MAYEYDPITGRNMADRQAELYKDAGRSTALAWFILGGVVLAIVVLLVAFGGPSDEAAPVDGAPATSGQIAPMGSGTAPGQPGGEAAPQAPFD